MIKSQEFRDFEVARELQQRDNCFGLTENAILPKTKDKENYKPRTLIDQTLELIDPTPNIYTLFMQFNERFFWNVLLPVEVKWSNRMTSCAGICTFHRTNKQCVIALSAPLLKLRPRKDLVETLLHEMIHGYLFLTNNNRDRDGHGPEFCKHMDRINKVAGTKITIYHSFHDEVKLYQQHWWRCNGPCQKKAPYFGTVRRAMNRAPGPTDFWWKEHQQTCGGQFIKIKEPENFKAKASKNKEKTKSASKNNNSANNMSNWLTKSPTTVFLPKFISTPKTIKSLPNTQNSLNGFQKLGNNTNNVHGWGTSGPKNSSNSSESTASVSNTPKFSSFGILGGTNTGKSILLSKFDGINTCHNSKTKFKKPERTIDIFISPKTKKPVIKNSQPSNDVEIKLVECPICSNFVSHNDINKHIDSCLITTSKETIYNAGSTISQTKTDNSSSMQKRKINIDTLPNKQPKLDNSENIEAANCPVCNKSLGLTNVNEHLDKCLLDASKRDNNLTAILNDTNYKNESIISISSTSSSNSSSSSVIENSKNPYPNSDSGKSNTTEIILHKCLVCNTVIPSEISLNDHLEDCIGSVFNDDSSLTDHTDDHILETTSEVSFEQNGKYPCPVCMQLISESFMNQHLDVCLKSS